MLEIISSGRNTQLLQFPYLETKFTYSHSANVTEDFQFFYPKNAFVSFNRKASHFELLRTCHKNDSDIIQRMKKRSIDDLNCGACSGIEQGEVALGLSTGFIRFFDIESAEFTAIKFKPDRPNNGVVNLDYSSCGELLASIYDDGNLNLFGLQTKIKMSTFKLDQGSTLGRFHPVKRFHLGIASTTGAITVLDTQSKRTFFQDKVAHKSPCPDIAWCTAKPETLVTVGYDCTLNVYDMRRKTVVTQTRNEHPYSTIDLSPCGLYCCAGNLKGDVISYDFRNLKEPLACKRTHETNVIRVAFVPPQLKTDKRLTFFTATEPISPNVDINARQANKCRDSINELLDLCSMTMATTTRSPAIVPPPQKNVFAKKRDSFLDIDVGVPYFENQPENNVDADLPVECVDAQPTRYSELRLKRTSKSRPSLTANVSVLSPVKQLAVEDDASETNAKKEEIENVVQNEQSTIEVGGKKRSNMKRMAMGPDDIAKLQIRSKNLTNVNGSQSTNSHILQESKFTNNKIPSTNSVTFMDQYVTTPIKVPSIKIDSDKTPELMDKENHNDVDMFSKFLTVNEINGGASSSTPNNHEQSTRNLRTIKSCDKNCASKLAAFERSIDDRFNRLYTMITESEERVRSAIDSMHMSLQFNQWSMEDTTIADIRDAVQQLLAIENMKKHYPTSEAGKNE